MTGAKNNDKLGLEVSGYINYPDKLAEDLGKTIQANGVTDGTMKLTLGDATPGVTVIEAGPLQFHFHAPSEHAVDGKLMDLEMHIVHQDTDGGLAVLGIFFDQGAGGSEANTFLAALQGDEGIMVGDLVAGLDTSAYWSYPGSLTTPPCSEGVKWTVLKEVQSIDDEQLAYFNDLWKDKAEFAQGNGNNRELMPINDRTLYSSGMGASTMMLGAASLLALLSMW